MTIRCLAITGLFLLTPALMAEDTLDKAKQELHAPKKEAKPRTDTHSGGNSQLPDDVEDATESVIGAVFVGIGIGIGYGVYACFLWPNEPTALMGVNDYPYVDDWRGWYAPFGNQLHPGKIVGGEVSAEGGWIEDDLQRYCVGGRVVFSAVQLRSEWSRYIEERDDGSHNTLNVGTIDAELGITFGPYGRLGLGAGATITHDSIGTEVGPCVAVGLDAFPIRPVVLHGVLTYGNVNDTKILTMRATLGVIWNRYEIYGGWQSTSIGSVDLDGPTAGVRVWF